MSDIHIGIATQRIWDYEEGIAELIDFYADTVPHAGDRLYFSIEHDTDRNLDISALMVRVVTVQWGYLKHREIGSYAKLNDVTLIVEPW